MRVSADGTLTYANPASAPIRAAWDLGVGVKVPDPIVAALTAVEPDRGFVEVAWAGRIYAVWPVLIRDLGFTNLYGTDVTAERAIVKFPDQNPNPVIRIDWEGSLVYANPASAGLVGGLGLSVGSLLPIGLRVELLDRARAATSEPLEVEAGRRAYALTAVDIAGFGFINVYGTDVTAVRERERLARENERLLLNVLPEPIARRLRQGEPLIADRFEDVTLMFADIVGFTRLSSYLSAHELVQMLNDVFTVFDELVDRHGLEKVKTIGDAYMVVGGMSDHAGDHTERVAAMALELGASVGAVDAATRHGVRFRIGLHAGPVVAGVIGTRKFIYDVWGDTVNVASRMESLGEPGRIQVTSTIVTRPQDAFLFESRGSIDVKGKGLIPTWFLEGPMGDGRDSGRGGAP
jgi:class 3 adenylate cyclase